MLLLVAAGHYFYDLPLREFFSDRDRWGLPFFQTITYLGESTVYLVVSGILFLSFIYVLPNRRQARRMLYVFSAIAVSGVAANLVKWLMGRWRPKMFSPEVSTVSSSSVWDTVRLLSLGPCQRPSWALALPYPLLYPRWRPLWIAVALLVAASVSSSGPLTRAMCSWVLMLAF
jgi:hypothetical protein